MNLNPQVAGLAMRDLAAASSVRKEVSAKDAALKPNESSFSRELTKEKAVPAQSKISTSDESRQQDKIQENQDAVTREKALKTFLDKMQSQLGVNPEEVVKAFSKLTADELAMPAEETIGKVIGQLELSEEDRKVATELYTEMLAMSAAASMSQYLKNQNEVAQVEVLGPKEAARRELNKNIGLMSDTFFNNKPSLNTAPQIAKAQAGQAYGIQTAELTKSEVTMAENIGRMDLPTGFELADAPAPVIPIATELSAIDVANMSLEEIAQNPMPMIQALEKELAELEKLTPNDPDLPVMKQSLEQLKASVAQSAQAPMMTAPKVDLSTIQTKQGMQAYFNVPLVTVTAQPDPSAMGNGEGQLDEKDSNQDFSQIEGLGQISEQRTQSLTNKEFIVNAPKASPADIQANVNELINQAQFLAKKGGGEMKVKLNPHGLGEVNLKVESQNGQLNIEMITSNDEAKKVLEKGIGELKASLAEQKLQIENIKIEAPKESSNQLSQQHDDAARHFQQRFLHDFREQNSQFRREFFDVAPARMPGSNVRDEASNSGTSLDPNARRQAARRLDLVA